jgi:guanine deaminase
MTDHLQLANYPAVANVADGGGPFGAVLVAPSGQVFEGLNRVTAVPDPTAHAEVQAIRAAAAGLGTHDLTGSVLYCSCEPCPMCLGAALWARVSRVVFAADRHDAAAAGFDDAAIHSQLAGGAPAVPVDEDPRSDRLTPFQAWDAFEERVGYCSDKQ